MNETEHIIEKYLILPKENISRLSFILEGYEGSATVTTIDKTRAIVKLFIMKDFVREIEELLERVSLAMKMESIAVDEPWR